MTELASLMPTDSEAYRLSQMVDENSGTYRIGELYVAVCDAMNVGKPNGTKNVAQSQTSDVGTIVPDGPKTNDIDTTATKPDTASPYNSAPMPDLSNITDLDIRTHEMLSAQAPARASVVGLDAKVPTVATPKTTPIQSTVGDGSPVPTQSATTQTSADSELANVIEAGTAGVEGRRPALNSPTQKPVSKPNVEELSEAFKAGVEGRRYVPKINAEVVVDSETDKSTLSILDAKQPPSTPLGVDGNSQTEYIENTENVIDDSNDTIHKNELYRRHSNAEPFSHLTERMSKKHVRQLAKRYGVDLEGVSIHIDKNEELLRLRYFGCADPEHIGGITLFPNAFESKEELLRTVYHEKVHVEQYRKYGAKYVQNNRKYFEDLAYKAEDEFIEKLKERGFL